MGVDAREAHLVPNHVHNASVLAVFLRLRDWDVLPVLLQVRLSKRISWVPNNAEISCRQFNFDQLLQILGEDGSHAFIMPPDGVGIEYR